MIGAPGHAETASNSAKIDRGASGGAAPVNPVIPAKHRATYKPDCESPESREDAEYCEERDTADATRNQALLTLGTLIVGVIGAAGVVVTLIFTAKAAGAAASAARTAERALTELERPYVVIDMRKSKGITRHKNFGSPSLGDPLRFRLVNHGRTPAILRETYTEVRVVPKDVLPMAVDPDAARGSPLPSGLVIPKDGFRAQERLLLNDVLGDGLERDMNRLVRIFAGEDYIYLLGYVSYADVFGSAQISGFCTVLMDDRWLIAGGDEYNYNKRDKRAPLTPSSGAA